MWRWVQQNPGATVAFSGEIGVAVRWSLADLGLCVAPVVAQARLYLTFDRQDQEAQRRLAAGEQEILAESLQLAAVAAELPAVAQAVAVMEQAVARGQWERQQTHASLLPFLESETAEYAAAVANWQHLDPAGEEQLCDELGDLLLQVLFHAEIARGRGAFSFNDVAASFVRKMQQRAPYLFDGSTGIVDEQTQDRLWQEGKQKAANAKR